MSTVPVLDYFYIDAHVVDMCKEVASNRGKLDELNEKIFDMEVKLLDGTITAGGPLYELMLNRVEQMKDMKYNLEQDGDILEDRRDKVLHQQTQGEEIISIN